VVEVRSSTAVLIKGFTVIPLEAGVEAGIYIWSDSEECTIVDNRIINFSTSTGYGVYGIRIDGSNNEIRGNSLRDNDYGFLCTIGTNNSIYHNNVQRCLYPAYVYESVDNWDNGCEGNYWSNYTGRDMDNDGVGDTLLPCEGVDNYPIVNVYWNPCDINHDLTVDMKDIAAAAKAFGTIPGSPQWNPHADITGSTGLPDKKVDMKDVAFAAKHFGERYP
jgi:parallel beta-helix repeat protein